MIGRITKRGIRTKMYSSDLIGLHVKGAWPLGGAFIYKVGGAIYRLASPLICLPVTGPGVVAVACRRRWRATWRGQHPSVARLYRGAPKWGSPIGGGRIEKQGCLRHLSSLRIWYMWYHHKRLHGSSKM